MRIVFVRHGESEANVSRVFSNLGWRHPLTAAGREQARAAAERLVGQGVVAVYSSPLRRAVETAQVVARRLAVPHTTDLALTEYDVGRFEDRNYDEGLPPLVELEARWRRGEIDARLPGSENRSEILARFVPFVAGLAERHAGDNATWVLVGHGGTLGQALPAVLANVDPDFAASHPLGYTAMVEARVHGDALRCERWDGVPFGN